MMILATHARRLLACLLCGGLLGAPVACSAGATHAPEPTSAATATPSVTARMPASGPYQILPFATADSFIPAPDGQLVAAASDPLTPITLFALDGTRHGSFTDPTGLVDYARWLDDSSGLLVWTVQSNNNYVPGPAYILESSGTLTPLGDLGYVVVASPDSSVLAAARPASGGQFGLVVESRHGGQITVLTQAADLLLLGWLGDRVVYAHAGSVWAIPAGGGTSTRLGAYPTAAAGLVPILSDPDAPDGSVVVLTFGHGPPYIATATGVSPWPRTVAAVVSDDWVGPHTVLGVSADLTRVVTEDLLTRQASPTPLSNQYGAPEAISGPWILWYMPSNSHYVVTNYQTGAVHDAGLPPNGNQAFEAPLAQGRFLLWDGQHAYLLDANSL